MWRPLTVYKKHPLKFIQVLNKHLVQTESLKRIVQGAESTRNEEMIVNIRQ